MIFNKNTLLEQNLFKLIKQFLLVGVAFFLIVTFIAIFSQPILAAEAVTESVVYQLKPDGTAQVTFTLNLANNYKWIESSITGFPIRPSNSSEMIISTKSMTIGDNPIDRTNIKYTGLRFNNIKQGLHVYTLNVQLSKPYGQVLPMSFIGIENRQRTTEINYPVSMGQPIRFTNQPITNIQINGRYKLVWNNSQKGWLFQIGDKQTYRIQRIIKYRTYDNIAKTKQFIFPGTSLYSQGGITNDIKLQYANMDNDGNQIASVDYSLNGKKIIYEAQVQYQKWDFSKAGFLSDIPDILVKKYTVGDGKYWDTEHPQIKQIVNKIVDPQKNVAKNIELLYNFTAEYIKYKKDFEIYRLQQRLTTAETLNNPEDALCSEFANLLITLNRAAGIPSRLVIGWGDTGHPNKFKTTVLHAWVQSYIPNIGWVDFDPTWQQTSKSDYFTQFDTNHVPFLILGKDPTWPAASNLEAFITSDEDLISIEVVNKIGATKNIAQFPALVVPESVIDLSGGSITSEVYDLQPPFGLPSFRLTLTKEQLILLEVAGGIIVFIVFISLFFKSGKKRQTIENDLRQSIAMQHTTPTIARITGGVVTSATPNIQNPPQQSVLPTHITNAIPTPPLTPPTVIPPNTPSPPFTNPVATTPTMPNVQFTPVKQTEPS